MWRNEGSPDAPPTRARSLHRRPTAHNPAGGEADAAASGVVVVTGGDGVDEVGSMVGDGVTTGEGDGVDSVAEGVVEGIIVGVAVGAGGDGLGVVAGTVVGGGVGVAGGEGGLDVVAEGAASGVGCARATAATGGAVSVRIDRPPLPLIPGGTGPGADGMETAPVR
jgi:hypothetical protein